MTRLILALFALSLTAVGQGTPEYFPDKVLGYKVHKPDLVVALRMAGEPRPSAKYDLLLTINEPRIVSIGLGGVSLEVTGQIDSAGPEGTVELVLFRNFSVNGIPVEISEIDERLPFSRKQSIRLIKPLLVEIGPLTLARYGSSDLLRTASKFDIRGTVLVFGRFKKLGLGFKRVIPLSVTFSIENTLFR